MLPTQGCFVKINQTEKKLLNGDYNNLIVTKGAGGADYDGVNYPAEKIKVYDVVGAGDTFLSALLYFHLFYSIYLPCQKQSLYKFYFLILCILVNVYCPYLQF